MERKFATIKKKKKSRRLSHEKSIFPVGLVFVVFFFFEFSGTR